jgi:hypothetical protein
MLFMNAFIQNSPSWFLFSFVATVGSFFFPIWLIPLNLTWHFIGTTLAWLIQPLFLMCVYFFVITPVGLTRRALNKKKSPEDWIARKKNFRFEKMF